MVMRGRAVNDWICIFTVSTVFHVVPSDSVRLDTHASEGLAKVMTTLRDLSTLGCSLLYVSLSVLST